MSERLCKSCICHTVTFCIFRNGHSLSSRCLSPRQNKCGCIDVKKIFKHAVHFNKCGQEFLKQYFLNKEMEITINPMVNIM